MDNPKHIKEFNQMLDRLVDGENVSAGEGVDPAMVDIARTLAAADLSDLSRGREGLRHRLARQGVARRSEQARGESGKRFPLLAAFSMGFATVLVIAFIGLAVILPLINRSTHDPQLAEMSPSYLATIQMAAQLTGTPAITSSSQPSPTLIPSNTPQQTVIAPPTVMPATSFPSATPPPPPMTASQGAATVSSCPYSWFTTAALAGSCPSGNATVSKAAYQPFERGAMVWRDGNGYIILPFDPATGQQLGTIMFALDPLTTYHDTSASYTPPSGRFAPISGFGILWRGDHLAQEGQSLMNVLGWGLESEVGYMVTEQSGTLSVQTGDTVYTYLTLPDGRVLELSRLDGAAQPTSMRILLSP